MLNSAGDTAWGFIEFTQQTANWDEEVGKVQRIEIRWAPNPLIPRETLAQVTHPEIGSYEFSRSLDTTGYCG